MINVSDRDYIRAISLSLLQSWIVRLDMKIQNGSATTSGIKQRTSQIGQVFSPEFHVSSRIVSRFVALTWMCLFLLCVFICISVLRIRYDGTILLKSAAGIFIMGFSTLVMICSFGISQKYYSHRYSCAKLNCGSEQYIRRVLSVKHDITSF